MGLCILNTKTMKMQFAGANNGMYHVRGSELTEYKPVRNPIGIYLKMRPFENRDVDIQRGDYVYMFSDGYSAMMLVGARLRHISTTKWGTRQYMDIGKLYETGV